MFRIGKTKKQKLICKHTLSNVGTDIHVGTINKGNIKQFKNSTNILKLWRGRKGIEMIKFIKDYKFRTVKIIKNNKEIATVSLDELKELVNNFDLDIQVCEEIK